MTISISQNNDRRINAAYIRTTRGAGVRRALDPAGKNSQASIALGDILLVLCKLVLSVLVEASALLG